MNPILNIITLIVGFVIGLYVNSQLFLPLIYGLPKSLWYFFKGEVKFMAIVAQFITPAIWMIGFFIIGFIFELINPEIINFLFDKSAFGAGLNLSLLAILVNFFFVSGRASMKADFDQTTYQKYKK